MLQLTFVILLTVIVASVATKLISRRRGPLPPGPPGYPIIGNLLDLPKPTERVWEAYARWSAQYGGLMSLQVFNETIIIINDLDTAIEMLDKKGSIYSERPKPAMVELCGFDRSLPFTARYKEMRRVIFRALGTNHALQRFIPCQEFQSTMLLKRIMSKPEDFKEAAVKTSGALVLQVTYGYRVQEDGQDPMVAKAQKVNHILTEITTPGRFLVDIFPYLQYLPSWIPLISGFKVFAAQSRKDLDAVSNDSLKFVQDGMEKGVNLPSYVGDLLADMVDDGSLQYCEMLDIIKWSAAMLFSAGTDSTAFITTNYFLAVIIYPEVQGKLQAEIDRVVGTDRLPCLHDRHTSDFPYLEAVIKELCRWMPPGPIGIPHSAIADDVHNGYLIPEGSVMVPNIWSFLHNPNTYKNPSVFNPDRFLGSHPERDPFDCLFGFGRRICPGTKLAEISLWLNIVKIAFAFHIRKAKTADGQVVEPVVGQTATLVSGPLPFKCSIEPRGGAVEMIDNALRSAGQ